MPAASPSSRSRSAAAPARARAPVRRALPRAEARAPTETRSRQPVVRAFLLYLASECGLANNSLHAYRRDLEDIEDFLATRKRTLTSADADDFRSYLQNQSRHDKATRTVARRLAATRSFLRYLIGQGHDSTPILQQLERPKPESSLPKVLSRAQVNQLI